MPEQEIEILRAGRHKDKNGIEVEFKPTDLEEIASSYDPSHFRAPLIVAHDNRGHSDRSLVDSEFAYGTPKQLRVVGDRLKAVFDKVAPEFKQWVRDGKLLSVSSSVYLRHSPNNPKPGKLSLRHIAALGKSPPAIKGMAPLALSEWEWSFGEEDEEAIASFCGACSLDEAGGILLATEQDKRMDEKEKALADREAALEAREAELRKAEHTSFCEGLKGQLIPAIASVDETVAFMEFLTTAEGNEISFSEDSKQTAIDWFKGLLKRLPQQVAFGEAAGSKDKGKETLPTDAQARSAYENAWKRGNDE